jgi:histone acetyltransferase (RNA polymerase elongator complex component)
MKTHAIIPIFIPHKGCPHQCVFCNQHQITGGKRQDPEEIIHRYLSTLKRDALHHLELAFYGGSFTAIPEEEQEYYLKLAKSYKDRGIISAIHLSTRPDYVGEKVLDRLCRYGVDVVELGVQSFHSLVLEQSGRGHTVAHVEEACGSIQERGIHLGIQLMIGLPGDSPARCLYSAEKTVEMGPRLTRIYPTVVMKGTPLYDMYQENLFMPWDFETTLQTACNMVKIIRGAEIPVIRMGLKASDILLDDKEVVAGTFHPSFRQLVESRLFKERMEDALRSALRNIDGMQQKVHFSANDKGFSYLIGYKKSNKEYFANTYSRLDFIYTVDDMLRDYEIGISLS